ncbi:MAG: IS66 family insertion sequence element accessory protein TnpB, partial [Clostridia bacterium]
SGIDRLAAPVQASFGLNPYSNTLFLFCGKRADRIKALYWDADGFVLLYKRPEQGGYQWPRTPEAVRELTQRQLRWLQEGLAIDQPKAHHPVSGIGDV